MAECGWPYRLPPEPPERPKFGAAVSWPAAMMERRIARLEAQAAQWEAEGEAHRSYLARFYIDWCSNLPAS